MELTRSGVQDEIIDVLLLQKLDKESRPVSLDLDSSGVHQGRNLVRLLSRKRIWDQIFKTLTLEKDQRERGNTKKDTVIEMPSSWRMRQA